MGTVVRAAIAGGLDRLLDHDYRLRLAGADADPEDVHQARVATRRLRSDLKTLSGLIDPIWVEHTRSELRWIGTVLGQVRDADVLDQTVADDGYAGNADSSSSAGRDELHRRLRSERQDAARRLAEAMVTPRYFDLLDRLHAAAGRPPLLSSGNGLPPRLRAATPGGPARQGLPLLLKKRRRAVAKSVRRAGPHPSDQDLHQIRIHSKNLRYAAELAEPVLGKPAARTAENAKRVQTVLGEHHDASTAAEWLRRAALDGPPVMSFEAGRLAARQEAAKDRAYRRWRKARRALQS
jgi:CHAD domain-containing protein